MTEKVEAIKTASARFADAAKVCSYQKQEIIYHEIQQNRSEVKENRLRIERSRSEATQNYETLGHVLKSEAKETRQDMEWKLAAMLEGNNATMRGQIESSNIELRNRMDVLLECFLSSNDRIDPETHDRKLQPWRFNGSSGFNLNSAKAASIDKHRSKSNCEAQKWVTSLVKKDERKAGTEN